MCLYTSSTLRPSVFRWWTSRANCTTDTDTRSVTNKATKELEVTHMYGVFMVLGAFVVLAVIVEVIERINTCVEDRKRKKVKKLLVCVIWGNGLSALHGGYTSWRHMGNTLCRCFVGKDS